MPAHHCLRSAFPTRTPARSLVRSAVWSAIRSLTPILLLLSGLTAQTMEAAPAPVPRAQRHEYRHEIDQLEDAWRAAMLKGNSAAMESLLADDYTAITAKGAIQTKEQALNNLKSGAFQLRSLSISDRKVRIYGTTAVVTSLAELTGSRNDQDVTGRYRYTRVYVRNPQGQWKIVSFEASRIQETPDRK
ncbi:nuclear transport factor 2 family protein [Acidicapsa acidisoli]|uniref:nuclear transport factor 2 family protein n=1 Tax=Acidicapsa acidisoli TaxID=1615681 RepID=UPI0021E0BB3C|nr:nuclear transport factor 2 family protein [Acidicapsa acidisoli]